MTLAAVYSQDWASRPHPDTIVLLLHGYGSHERDLPGIFPHLGIDAPMVSLRAPLESGNGGFAWFALGESLRMSPESIEEATAVVWRWVDDEVPPDARLITVGFSQGGCMATQLLRTRPERIAGTVVLSGFVLGAPQPADATLADARPAVFWGRGTADSVVPPALVAEAAAWLGPHTTLTERVYEGLAHSINDVELADVSAHLAQR